MCRRFFHYIAKNITQSIIDICGYVMKFIDRNHRIVKYVFIQFIAGKSKGGMGANKNSGFTKHEIFKCIYLAFTAVTPRRAKVVLIDRSPICKKPVFL